MNILNAIREQFSPEVLAQIGNAVGESPGATKTALEHSLSALLGSAAARASSPDGATDLFNLLKGGAPQGGWGASTSSLPANFAADPGSGAASFINTLLGPKASLIRDFIASRAGIRSGSASTLLNTGGQLLMGVLGSQVGTQGLGASSFGQLLRSQIPHLQGFLSPELAGILGIGNLLSTPRTPTPQPAYAGHSDDMAKPSRDGAASGGRALRWALIPLFLLLGAIFLGHQYRQANMGGASDDVNASAGAGVSTNLQLPRADTFGLIDRLKNSIASLDGQPVDLAGVNFDSSGNLLPAAKGAVAAIGNMMKNNPSAKAMITVYGASGDEATARANQVKSTLVNMGIPDERVTLQPQVGQGMPKISFAK
jgi:hypothetical protein